MQDGFQITTRLAGLKNKARQNRPIQRSVRLQTPGTKTVRDLGQSRLPGGNLFPGHIVSVQDRDLMNSEPFSNRALAGTDATRESNPDHGID